MVCASHGAVVLAGAQPHDDVADARRLAGLELEVAPQPVALVEQPDDATRSAIGVACRRRARAAPRGPARLGAAGAASLDLGGQLRRLHLALRSTPARGSASSCSATAAAGESNQRRGQRVDDLRPRLMSSGHPGLDSRPSRRRARPPLERARGTIGERRAGRHWGRRFLPDARGGSDWSGSAVERVGGASRYHSGGIRLASFGRCRSPSAAARPSLALLRLDNRHCPASRCPTNCARASRVCSAVPIVAPSHQVKIDLRSPIGARLAGGRLAQGGRSLDGRGRETWCAKRA